MCGLIKLIIGAVVVCMVFGRRVPDNTSYENNNNSAASASSLSSLSRCPASDYGSTTCQRNKFKYDAWLSDITLRGLTNYSFNNLDVFPEDMKVTANISFAAPGSDRRLRGTRRVPDVTRGVHGEAVS
ncbi:hypothetical protein ACJJTC_011224 [Scirpophaga incertulas]